MIDFKEKANLIWSVADPVNAVFIRGYVSIVVFVQFHESALQPLHVLIPANVIVLIGIRFFRFEPCALGPAFLTRNS